MSKIMHIVVSFLAACVLVGLTFAFLPAPEIHLAASQAAIVVDTLDDELNNDGDCSLREAIQAATDNAPVDACPAGGTIADTITFSVAGTVLLNNQLLLVSPGGPLVIDGGGAITLSGNTQVRIFLIFDGVELTLKNLSLVDGYDGTLGGSIYNIGGLSIYNSTFARNQVGEGDGGAIYNVGTLHIEDSDISDNSVSDDGGGIYNAIDATLQVSSSVIRGNNAGQLGGGINNQNILHISHSLIEDNHAIGTSGNVAGGGIFNLGTITMTDTAISANSAKDGGGIMNGWAETSVATLIVANSTLFTNTAEGDGGGIHNGWSGKLAITNSTLAENSAGNDGGGIFWAWNYYGTTSEITNSTLNGNQALGSGDNVHSNNTSGTSSFRNSIVAGSPTGDNCSGAGLFIDLGFNIEDADSCGFSPSNGSMPDTDPLLAALQDNGGPTWTQALYPGSPAIDTADPLSCPVTDQRGAPRPVDGDGDGDPICDIGAFEFRQPTTTTIISDLPNPSYIGEPFTLIFNVTATQGIPTGTVTVAGGNGTCLGDLVEGLGSCQMSILESGTYTLTATYNGNEIFDFSRDTEIHMVIPKKLYVYLPLIVTNP